MTELPWFKFEASRFMHKTRLLTAEQRGYYVALLCEAWTRNPAGSLPNDKSVLWKLAGARSRKQFEKKCDSVLQLFVVAEKLLWDFTLSEQHEAAEKVSESRKFAGAKGLEKQRWRREKEKVEVANADAIATAIATANGTDLPVQVSGRIERKTRQEREPEPGAPLSDQDRQFLESKMAELSRKKAM